MALRPELGLQESQASPPPDQPIPPRADNLADIRARFARSWEGASSGRPEIEQTPVPTPPGFVAWRIKGTSSITVLPQLLPHAPFRVRVAYGARVISNLTGTCPLCTASAQSARVLPDFCRPGRHCPSPSVISGALLALGQGQARCCSVRVLQRALVWGRINRRQGRDGQGQPAEQHQPPPGGRIVPATVNKDNQQELDHCQHPKDRGRSLGRATGRPTKCTAPTPPQTRCLAGSGTRRRRSTHRSRRGQRLSRANAEPSTLDHLLPIVSQA